MEHGRSRPLSFPRKRESTLQAFRNALVTDWIPAFAGMTGVGWGDTITDNAAIGPINPLATTPRLW